MKIEKGKLLGIFANKWFSLYFVSATFSQVGSQIYRLAIPWMVLEMTNSVGAMSVMWVVETAPFIFLGPFLGVFIDRFDRRKIMLWSDFFRAILIFTVPTFSALGILQIWHLFVIGFLLTIFTICFDLVADFGLIPQLVNKEQLTAANSANIVIQNLSNLVGPAVAGALIAFQGAKNALLFDAISYFLTLIVVFFLPVNFNPSRKVRNHDITTQSIIKDIKDGFAFIFHSQILRVLVLWSFLLNVAIGALFTVMTYRLGSELQLSSTIVGSVYSIMGATALVGSLIAPYLLRFMPLGRALTIVSIVGMVGAMILAVVDDWRTALVGYAILSVTGSMGNIYTLTVRQHEIPNEYMGRINASYRMILVLAFPFSAAILGGLANKFGSTFAFSSSAFMMLAMVLFTLFSSIPRYHLKMQTSNEIGC